MAKRIIGMMAAVFLALPMAALAFGVSPGTVELSGERGEVVDATFTLVNESTQDKTFYLSDMAFAPRDETGAPEFLPEEKEGLVNWIAIDPSVAVPARSKAEIPFKVAIPADALSGGQYAAILVSESPADVVATNGASVQARTAILLFLTVEGETSESLALLSYDLQAPGSFVSSADGIKFQYAVQNQGNVHVAPQGRIVVRDLFGRIISTADANPDHGRVLPHTTRTFKGAFESQGDLGFFATAGRQLRTMAFGPATVSLELTYGASETQLSDSRTTWLVPIELLILLITSAAALLLLAKGLRRRS
jgi:hypothetical protein